MGDLAVRDIFITVLLAAILMPIAFTLIFNANTTGWDSNTVTIFGYIPILAIVGIIGGLIVYLKFGRK